MAGMKAGEIRRQNILKDLQAMGCCTYEYLMKQYQISERSMQSDIKELCRQGYQIKGVKAKQGYVLKQPDTVENRGYFESTDARKVRNLFLMLILQNCKDGMTIEELLKEMSGYEYGETMADIKTIQTALKDLTKERMVALRGDRYVVSVHAPLQIAWSLSDALDILNLLETCAEGSPYEKNLEEIRRNLMIALFNEPEEEEAVSPAYVVYHKSFETAGRLEEYMEMLNSCPFEEKLLFLTYHNRSGEEKTIPYAVGNVVYSVDKDRLYLLGETNGFPMIVNCAAIKKIETSEEKNEIFQNDYYTEIIDKMFSISLEPAQHVVVEFDHVFGIQEKLKRLKSNRPAAVLYTAGNKLVYEDDISGMSDFANYLRRYGSSCKVLEPPELREAMLESARRIIKGYEGLEEKA